MRRASGPIWFKGSAMLFPFRDWFLPSFCSAFQGSSFTPRLAPFMVPKWLHKFQALLILTMMSQGEDLSPGSSFKRRGNFFLIWPRQLTLESPWSYCVTSPLVNHYPAYLGTSKAHPRQMGYHGEG